jgi:hypothetical protein
VLGGRCAPDGSGVVDQDVDVVAFTLEPADQLVRLGSVGEIARLADEPTTGLLDEALDLRSVRFWFAETPMMSAPA